jgi:hypothetical protein
MGCITRLPEMSTRLSRQSTQLAEWTFPWFPSNQLQVDIPLRMSNRLQMDMVSL